MTDRNYTLLELNERGEAMGTACPAASLPVLAIGVFDGVHLGHRSLLEAGLAEARRRGAQLKVLTFWPHPEAVVRGADCPERFLLSTLPEKADLLRSCGAGEVLVLAFTPEAASTDPEVFVRRTLGQLVHPRAVVVGFNFTFGRDGRGTPATLADLGRGLGMEVLVHPAVRLGGEVVSSSAIRSALARGDVERAGLLLGRPYSLAGRVEPGAARGRTLGFPTANVTPAPGLACPAPGVYACWAVRGRDASLGQPPAGASVAVANIGTCPTFTSGETCPPLRLETHVLEGPYPDYGDEVRVYFGRRLRAERRFSGVEQLRAQITIDRAEAARFFGLHPGVKEDGSPE